MRIRKVTIQNLNSLRLTTTIDFDQPPLSIAGLFAITGDTGAGKTTILDAITLALYGRIHRNKEVHEVLSYGATECMAEVEFDNGAERYLAKWTLWRARNRLDGNIQAPRREVSRWEEEKQAYVIIAERVREADEVIEAVTGLDYDRFTRSVLLAQGDFAAFLQANEKDRSDLLERITGTAIYTQISQAAYERHKQEGLRLQELHREREALRLLSPEEKEELQKEVVRFQQQIEGCRQDLEMRRSELLWWRRREELERRQQQLEVALSDLQQEEADAAPDLQRLAQYQHVRSFEAPLHRLDDLLQSIRESEEEKNRLQDGQEVVIAREKEAQDALRLQEEALRQERERLTEQRPVLEKTLQLDTAISEKKGPLDQERLRLAALQAEMERIDRAEAEEEKNVGTLREKLDELNLWLQHHQVFQHLQDDLSGMEQLAFRLEEKQLEIQHWAEQIEQLSGQRIHLAEEITGLQQQEEGLAISLQQLEDKFRRLASGQYVATRAELLDRLAADLEQLGQRREGLHRLTQLAEEYQELLRQMDRQEEELEGLISQELELSKELMTALETLEQVDADLQYRRDIYQQQQLIANYEKDRRQLREGDPCPLCFSREHPFRREEVKPYVDKARRELERATARREKVFRAYQALLSKHSAVAVNIEHLAGDQSEGKGRRKELQDRIEQYEMRIAQLTPALHDAILAGAPAGALQARLQQLEHHLVTGRRQREELQQAHMELDRQERRHRNVKEALQEKAAALAILAERVQGASRQQEVYRKETEGARLALEQKLGGYAAFLSPASPTGQLHQLQDWKNQFSRRQDQRRDMMQELGLAAQRRQQLQTRAEEMRNNLAMQQDTLQVMEKILADLQRQRKELFGERDPMQEREALEQRIQQLETEWEAGRQQLRDIQQQRERLEAQIQQRKSDAVRLQERADRSAAELENAVRRAGVDSLADVRAALLPPEEAEQLESLRQGLERRLLETRRALEDARLQLHTHLEERQLTVSEEYLLGLVQELDERLTELLQYAGALRERLAADEARRAEAAALTNRIEEQQREFRRWAMLNDVIGAADGKKFRVFAQGLTLRRLVARANEHLRHLNGRYLIRKRSEEDLGLEIVDTYQADHCRSMNTLSGGESFLVSLALALGLSNLAGQQTDIRSLFIDEGFGTLDENSLDVAISTLENLQAEGKTIGIISHVKELKERIAVQIQVRKRANGFSEVAIIG